MLMGPLQEMLSLFFMVWTHSILNLSLLWALIQINPLLQATARTLGKKKVTTSGLVTSLHLLAIFFLM